MAQRDGPAIDVEGGGVEVELLLARDGLRGEGFVDLGGRDLLQNIY